MPNSSDPRDMEMETQSQWSGSSKVLGPRLLKMPTLTVGMIGIQIIWSVEMSYASPYLLSLGLSKALMSIVFLAGPLSGLIVQPLIGALSDNSRSRFGRRRPYIFFGVLVNFGAMYLFGFTRQFASLTTKENSSANDALTIGLAVLSIYCIDFSINAVQAMDRALLVDILPTSEQERGNAWAGRMFGVGSVVGFFVGNVDLTRFLPFWGGTQLEILCVVTSGLLLITHLITICNVKERFLSQSVDRTAIIFSYRTVHKNIWSSYLELPKTIKQICLVQLFAWIGWFPVLFWTSLYVGGLYKRNSPIPETDAARAALEAEATRLGSRALLCNALASLIASVICPFFVSNTDRPRHVDYGSSESGESSWLQFVKREWRKRPTCHLANLWAVSHGIFAACMLSTFAIKNVVTATLVMTIAGFSWAITQWAPYALIAEEIHGASVISSQYALGDMDETDLDGRAIPLHSAPTEHVHHEESLGDSDERRRLITEVAEDSDEDQDDRPSKHVHFRSIESDQDDRTMPPAAVSDASTDAPLHRDEIREARFDDAVRQEADGVADDSGDLNYPNPHDRGRAGGRSIEDKAGIILGIHNVFIVIPQFIITGLSSIVFAIIDAENSDQASRDTVHIGGLLGIATENKTTDLNRTVLSPRAEPGTATGSVDSIAVVFRIGGLSVAIASILAFRLAKELRATGL